MRNCFKLIIASAIFCSATIASATVPGAPSVTTKKLTPAQCTKLRSDFEQYVDFIESEVWLAKIASILRPALRKLAAAVVQATEKAVDKACPAPAAPVDAIYECQIFSEDFTQVFHLGLNSSGQLVAENSPNSIACVSQQACINIVGTRFFVGGILNTPRCANGSTDPGVTRLSDAQVQSKISQIP